ncbi:hypothetical protein LTR95_014580 [Oleoguttula sp. CCFEE 5521]
MLPLWSVALVAITQLLSGLYLPLSGDLLGAVARSWCAVFGCASATISAPTYVAPVTSSLVNLSGFGDLASGNFSSPASLLGVSAQSAGPEGDGMLPSPSEWMPVNTVDAMMATPTSRVSGVRDVVVWKPQTSTDWLAEIREFGYVIFWAVSLALFGFCVVHIARYLACIPARLLAIVAACIIKAFSLSAEAYDRQLEFEQSRAVRDLQSSKIEALEKQSAADKRTIASMAEKMRKLQDHCDVQEHKHYLEMNRHSKLRRAFLTGDFRQPSQSRKETVEPERLSDTSSPEDTVAATPIASQEHENRPSSTPFRESSDLTVVEHPQHSLDSKILPVTDESTGHDAIEATVPHTEPTTLTEPSSPEHTVSASPIVAQEIESSASSIERQESSDLTVVENSQQIPPESMPVKIDSIRENTIDIAALNGPTPLIETSEPEYTVAASPVPSQESESRPSSVELQSISSDLVIVEHPRHDSASEILPFSHDPIRNDAIETMQTITSLPVQPTLSADDAKVIERPVKEQVEPMEIDDDSVIEKIDCMDLSDDHVQPSPTVATVVANSRDSTVEQTVATEMQVRSSPATIVNEVIIETAPIIYPGPVVAVQSQQPMDVDQKIPVAETQDTHMADQKVPVTETLEIHMADPMPDCKEVEMSDVSATSTANTTGPTMGSGGQQHTRSSLQTPAMSLFAEYQTRPQSRFPSSALTKTANTTSQQHSRGPIKTSVVAGNPALHLHVPAITFPLASSSLPSIEANGKRLLNLTTLFKTTLQLDGTTLKVVSPTQEKGGVTKSKAGSPKQLQGKAAKDRTLVIQKGFGSASAAFHTNVAGGKVTTGDVTMRDTNPSAPSATAASSASATLAPTYSEIHTSRPGRFCLPGTGFFRPEDRNEQQSSTSPASNKAQQTAALLSDYTGPSTQPANLPGSYVPTVAQIKRFSKPPQKKVVDPFMPTKAKKKVDQGVTSAAASGDSVAMPVIPLRIDFPTFLASALSRPEPEPRVLQEGKRKCPSSFPDYLRFDITSPAMSATPVPAGVPLTAQHILASVPPVKGIAFAELYNQFMWIDQANGVRLSPAEFHGIITNAGLGTVEYAWGQPGRVWREMRTQWDWDLQKMINGVQRST